MARRLSKTPQALIEQMERLAAGPASGEMPAYVPAGDGFASPILSASVEFRDRNYRLRTLISPGGRRIRVEHGLAVVADSADIAWLDQHPDFERND